MASSESVDDCCCSFALAFVCVRVVSLDFAACSSFDEDEDAAFELDRERMSARPLPEPRRLRGTSLGCAIKEEPAVDERVTRTAVFPEAAGFLVAGAGVVSPPVGDSLLI